MSDDSQRSVFFIGWDCYYRFDQNVSNEFLSVKDFTGYGYGVCVVAHSESDISN